MNITLDITKGFNTLVNSDYFLDVASMNPFLFLDYPNEFGHSFDFELMNFGLSITDALEKQLLAYSPLLDTIINCEYVRGASDCRDRGTIDLFSMKFF